LINTLQSKVIFHLKASISLFFIKSIKPYLINLLYLLKRLKEIMNQKGISREELSNKVGVSMTTISNINSEKNLPTIHLLLQIATALDVDIREMFVPTKGNLVVQSEIEEAKDLIKKGLEKLGI
jgi:transcriptional regulator with XRE-family HTH domain